MNRLNKLINLVEIRYIWIFITERCNLNCDYCFFRYRNNKKTLKISYLHTLLREFCYDKSYSFVISGGEPLLCWNLTKNIIIYIKNNFPKSLISIQTNILNLTHSKVKFLRENNIVIEPGLDGDFFTNYRHRLGLNKSKFEKCIQNLKFIIKKNLRVNPTMTIHPQEVEFIFENFIKLVSLGLNSIEIHPAFLEDWDRRQSQEFLKQYKKIIEYERCSGKYLICKSYSLPINISLDFVILPNGFILPNWTYLAFPHNLRKKFYIFRLSNNDITILKDNLLFYVKKLKSFFKLRRTYREFSDFNAYSILNYAKDAKLKNRFLIYKDLCERIKKIDQSFLNREDLINVYQVR